LTFSEARIGWWSIILAALLFLILVWLTMACGPLSIGLVVTPTPTKTPKPFTPTAVLKAVLPSLAALTNSTEATSLQPTDAPGAATPTSPVGTLTTGSTLTPGPAAPTHTPIPNPMDSPIPTFQPSPTSPPPTVPPAIEPPGWSLASVRLSTDQEEGLVLYGDLINNTGSPQALALITGTFYNDQGQVVAGEDSVHDYWPAVDAIPSGGRLPFELTVDGIQGDARFTLRVEAELSSESPRQDFEFADLKQWNEEGVYCVGGTLRNPGGELQVYLVVVVVLYDNQDRVVNFGDYNEPYPIDVVGGQLSNFEICVDPHGQGVARYELRAWGQ